MKIGIAGAGTIVPDFLEAQALIEEMQVRAICASHRSEEKMKQLSAQYGIERIYFDYEDMLEDPQLDVIYIAVPNHLHYEFSRKAMEKGKSVICEKPFCSNDRQAEELVAMARERHLFLFEAISNQYFPNYKKVRELLPALGDVKLCELNYSQYSRRYDEFKKGNILPVFDPAKSGGALMDLNVYNIHFITGLFGRPEWIHYTANMERDIDTSGILIMKYKGFACSLMAAKSCAAPVAINIEGDEGYLHSSDTANVFSQFVFKTRHGEPEAFALNEKTERLYYELRAFTDMVLSHDMAENDRNLEHSLMVQQILDEARKQAGIYIPE